MICARSAYLHTGQRPYQAALEGLIHDRTRSRGRAAQNLLARMGASIHGIWTRSLSRLPAQDRRGERLALASRGPDRRRARRRGPTPTRQAGCQAAAAQAAEAADAAASYFDPRVMITDKLTRYGAAKREIMPGVEHRQHKGLNNRAENSHQPTRRRERQ